MQAPALLPSPNIAPTQCQSWPIASASPPVIGVRCYHKGQLIQCCGHGLLSAAHYWQQRLNCDQLALQINGSTVHSWRAGELTWLSFSTLATHACDLPDWVERFFPGQTPPVAAAVAGDEHGYLVLQWPDAFSLAQLPRPDAFLAEYTQRALICTAAQLDSGRGSIQLRYFAPQYGVIEDIATGSAMRVLSHYWSPRFTSLTAWQCSTVGGQLFANYRGVQVEVGGRCVAANVGCPLPPGNPS